ncbi:MAG: hypothetical protein LUI60_04040 [Clostridia bacterium]|nr:hypothetical protein [Clostridia bacterium]
MEVQDIKKQQDAIYNRLVTGGVNVSREELSVDEQTLDKCHDAADRMVNAMEKQDNFYSEYSEVSVKIQAGLEVDEEKKAEYENGLEECKRAIKEYSDAHILAHRTEYAAQLAAYRAADASTLKKLSAYRYDRDVVDGVIAVSAAREWKEKHREKQGKNCLLVGRNAIGEGIDQLIDSNTHSPIPIKEASSTKVKIPYGEPMYPMLNPNIKQDNNDLRPVNYVEEVHEEKVVEQVKEEKPAIKRVTRTYNDQPSPTRRRTLIAADLLFEERLKKGVKLSPDPAAKQKSKTMDKDAQELDNILQLKTNGDNTDGSAQ